MQIDCEDKIVPGMLTWSISSHRDGQRWQLGPWNFKKKKNYLPMVEGYLS